MLGGIASFLPVSPNTRKDRPLSSLHLQILGRIALFPPWISRCWEGSPFFLLVSPDARKDRPLSSLYLQMLGRIALFPPCISRY
jgi:hypothetical protein